MVSSFEIFYNCAKTFCDFVDSHQTIREVDYPCWINQLTNLYRNALELVYPLSAPDTNNVDVTVHLKSETSDFYWTLYTPLALDKPVGGCLTNDIQEIYQEIKRGLVFAQQNTYAALWEWKFGFDNHWGNHAIDAIRALHYMIRK